MRWVVPALLSVLLVSGCTVTHDVERGPLLEPPPARGGAPLTKDEALALAKDPDIDHAIEELDAHRLAFVLDAPTIAWFEKEGAAVEVSDYLSKRARVDWEGLRGDIDPRTPEEQYIDPRRGFDDWAGFGRRDSYASYRSLDPFSR